MSLTPTGLDYLSGSVWEQTYQDFMLAVLLLSGKHLVKCVTDTRGQCVFTDQP